MCPAKNIEEWEHWVLWADLAFSDPTPPPSSPHFCGIFFLCYWGSCKWLNMAKFLVSEERNKGRWGLSTGRRAGGNGQS